jgi:hypothetical protein
MRFAQEALGHNSEAIHAYYGKHAKVKLPCLESWENDMKQKITALNPHALQRAPGNAEDLRGHFAA